MTTESSKRAYDRYRFKNSTCLKTCMLHESKGGFCPGKKDQIDHCLALYRQKKDGRDYRSIETTLEWIEVFCEEAGLPFQPSIGMNQKIADMLSRSSRDCYTIAEKIVEELKCPTLVQLLPQ